MKKKENNHAYIDGANLHNGVASLGWQLDYARFRIWLTEKYNVDHAYIFLGLIPSYSSLYKYLQEIGFTLLSPRNSDKCSVLLKRTNARISYIDDQRSILETVNKKAPDKDGTLQGSLS